MDYQKYELWKDVSEKEWNDWQWQVKNRLVSVEDLKKVLPLEKEEEETIGEALKN